MLGSTCSAVCPDIYCHLHTLHRESEWEWEREREVRGRNAESSNSHTTILSSSHHLDETFLIQTAQLVAC